MLAGGSASIIRAGVMGMISSLGIVTGRVYSAKWALFLSVILMLIYSPLFIIDISFQLSVSATVGILWLHPIIEKFLPKFEKKKSTLINIVSELREAFITTLSASWMTIPIVLMHFGRLSLIALLANTLLLWLVPFIMLFAAFFLLIGSIHPFVATALSFFVWSSGELFIQAVSFLSMVPLAEIEVEHGQWILVVLMYILTAYVLFRCRKNTKKS
jgi:competence protein ComEC